MFAVVGLVGCGGGGSSGGGTGGTTSGTGGTATGTGGASPGSGGSTASGTGGSGQTDAGSGSGGTPAMGSGGTAGSGTDAATDAGNDTGSGTLHGGTSGAYICPAAGNYAGMVPTMSGTFTMSTGANTNNGEGPVWVGPLGALIFSSKFAVGGDADDFRQIWKLAPPNAAQVSVKSNVGNNGMTLDNDDKIVSANHQLSAIVRIDPATGEMIDTIAEKYMGNYFQSPNDVIVRGDGNIYFSDPAYFASQGKKPKTATTAFYRISPAKVVSVVEDEGTKDPNGVALSPDDNTLYTLVTADQQVKKWALGADGSINGAGANFVKTASTPDGMCVDCAGNLYVSTLSGVQVFSPAGQMVATIGGGKAINCSFGGADHKTLFITSDTHVRYGTMNIPGLP
ncbi:MAG TPA: SMP-30/gluconolactonase/LRE family protein [Polyangia bacterium]|nr:SMP-30/gluconolactonase/LRE family protein [Polyangia bacterium]